MPELASESLTINISLFFLAVLAIAVSSTWMIAIAKRLPKQTGIDEALIGAWLWGFSTALPGIVTLVTTAFNDWVNF